MSAERSPDVRRSPPKNIFGGRPADPRGSARSPRVSARIRAEPRRKVFRRANSLKASLRFNLYLLRVKSEQLSIARKFRAMSRSEICYVIKMLAALDHIGLCHAYSSIIQ